MQMPPEPQAQARQVASGQQGLDQEQRQCDHAGEACGDIDRIAPSEQRTGRRDHDRRGQSRVAGPPQHRSQEDRLEAVGVVFGIIGEMRVRLAKGRHDLRHFHPEYAICIGPYGALAMRVSLMPLGRVRPHLDAHTRERSAITRTPDCAGQPEIAAADAADDWRAGKIVVVAAAHRGRTRDRLEA